MEIKPLRMRKIDRRWVLRGSLAAGIAGAASAGWAQPPGEKIRPGERAAMTAAAMAFMGEYSVPGLAIAVTRNGQLAYAQGFGVADKSTGEKLTPNHLFRVASVSKPITSVAIFSLLEQGKLKLADKVFGAAGILGSEYGARSEKFVQDITIEHLLIHASGGWSSGRGDPMFSNKQMSREELISWTLENVPLARPPGTKFAYSNFGYCVLGRVIEKVTRQRYADFVRDSVLARCGIDRMRIAGNSLDERAEGEVVHYRGTSNPYALDVTRLDATGGWLASATDLVRFVTHVDGLSYTPNILQTSSIATMTTPSAVHPRYAYGWGVIGGDWWHDGGLPGTTSIIARTQSGFCWAALANSNRSGSNQALDKSVRTMIRSVRGWSA